MNSQSTYTETRLECSVVLTYTDMEKVNEIDQYYIGKMKELRKSPRLTEQDKTGQRAFLHQQWQAELGPFLQLWRVKLYSPEEAE